MNRRAFIASTGSATLTACTGTSHDRVEARWPPIGDFVRVDGLRVHYWEQGRGQPVILVHGASGNLRDFTFDLAPRLAKHYRVIAFDRPGFGYSDRLTENGWQPAAQAAHLSKAAATLGADRPIVVGHSWGGALAMAWAVAEGDRLAGAVSLAGATMPWGGKLAFYYSLLASDITGGPLAWLINRNLSEKRVAGLIGETFAPQPVPAGYADYIGGPLATRTATLRGNAHDLTRLDAALTDQSEQYGQVACPVEIVHGMADVTVAANLHSVRMNQLLPDSNLTLLKGVGHMPHHAEPEAAEAAIARLAARTS